MELNAYFDFISDDDIRLAGTRIGIETILSHYLNGVAPETLAEWYPELSLDQIFATLTYYFANQTKVDTYLADLDTWFETEWQQQQLNPSPVRQRLMRVQRQQQLARLTA